MAIINKTGIGTGNTVQAEHITRIIDTLTNSTGSHVTVSGSFTGAFSGSATITGGTATLTTATLTNAVINYNLTNGLTPLATGANSHAEGRITTSSGNYSHAEGEYSISSGQSSHAEGYNTTASGVYSHAEGNSTQAGGQGAHTEGYQTTAAGNYSHAEGWNNIAKQTAAHAEGRETFAMEYAHSEGYQTSASGYYTHAEGWKTEAIGTYSHAEGESSTANGASSHAEGYNTYTLGQYAHAEGYLTSASGNYSHTEGSRTLATYIGSHAEGYNTTASATYAHAEGGNTLATGSYSHAEGYYTTATGSYSHAEGNGTIASGQNAHSEGVNTLASGLGSHAEGNNTDAVGEYSHTEGWVTYTLGQAAHAEGYYTSASGNYSHAEGYNTRALDTACHAEGENTLAMLGYSHAEGGSTTASGYFAHSEGEKSLASGRASHAEGYNTTASGNYSHAEGIGTIASGSGQLVSGKYNKHGDSTSLTIIGDGTNDSTRTDILKVKVGAVEISGSLDMLTRGSTSATNAVTIKNSTGNAVFSVRDDGNVGIGTLNATADLYISASAPGVSASTVTMQHFAVTHGAPNTDQLLISNTRFRTGSFWNEAGYRIQSKVDNTFQAYIQFNGTSGSNNDNGISFGTGASTVSGSLVSEAMRINGAGQVGIGTSAPSHSLHIDTAFGITSTGQDTNQLAYTDVTHNTHWGGSNWINTNSGSVSLFRMYGGIGTNTYYPYNSSGFNFYTSTIASSSIPGSTAPIASRLFISASGNIGIGTEAPNFQLTLSTNSAYKPGDAVWQFSSDARLKENILEANYDTCYDIVKNLPLKRYTWKNDVYTTEQVADRSKLGWIAQDVETVFPKAVSIASFSGSGDFYLDDCRSMNVDQVYAVMYGTIKKLIVENESLKSELQTIKTHLGL